MRRAFKLSFSLLGVVAAVWLSFVAWSVYSTLPRSAVRLTELAPPERAPPDRASTPDPKPPGVEAEDLEPSDELNLADDRSGLSDDGQASVDEGCVRRLPPKGWNENLGFAYEKATIQVLTEKAMAGDGAAQFTVGWKLREELLQSKDISPSRSEYVSNFLILGIRDGYVLGALFLADIYKAQGRDPVDIAAWLQIYESLSDRANTRVSAVREMQERGIVLSDTERAASVSRAEELTELYDLPVSRDRPALVSGDSGSRTRAAGCRSEKNDPYLTATRELEAYRAEVVRASNSPGAVSDAELRQRFRAVRSQLVRSLRVGNHTALSMLANLHRESSAPEDAVAAAAWDAVGAKLSGNGSDGGSSDPSLRTGTDAIQPGVLGEQYIMIYGLK